MQINSYTIKPGDYVRCALPRRQRYVPCVVEEITGRYMWVRPLSQKRVVRWKITIELIHSIIDPREVNNQQSKNI